METVEMIKLILILAICGVFVYGMVKKKISTVLALPLMGILTAFVATAGVAPMLGIFDTVAGVDPETGLEVIQQGIMTGVIGEGSKMMSSAIAAAIFGGSFAVLLNKLGIAEAIVKKTAELAGDKTMTIAIAFFISTVIIFAAIGGLGPVILVGSIALPIMMTAGISAVVAAAIVLLGISVGGILNPANYATFAAILEPVVSGGYTEAFEIIARMSIPIFFIVFAVSMGYIVISVKKGARYAWAVQTGNVNSTNNELGALALIAPVVPVILVLVSTFALPQILTAEFAILIGIIYTVLVVRPNQKLQIVTASFIEGTQQVSGAIFLLIGLGILIKGFQYYTVTPIIQPMIQELITVLQNPVAYIIGFTIATPLTLYRGPLNTFGIGGALPVIFASAGYSPIAIIWVLRSCGNMQGFGDPTNSHNIWIADFVQVDPNEITKKIFFIGILMTFLLLSYAVLVQGISLV